MHYETFQPHPDLQAVVKCYWVLQIPAADHEKQRIIPDGCIEMAFILGDDVKRFTDGDEYILQPRAMVLGQTIAPFYIQPVGYVDTFAIRFFPYGFANFVKVPIRILANTETPISHLFGETVANRLERAIVNARDTQERMVIIEQFLLSTLQRESTIDTIVKRTVDTLLATKGSSTISELLDRDLSKRRQLERKFSKQVGVSPKQLAKLIRLQSALEMLLNDNTDSLTSIAYQNEYYDQAHFIKDFKEFTGISPGDFLTDKQMTLSALFYSKE